MILICGIPTETPIALVCSQMDELNVPYVMFNQRDFSNMDLSFEIIGDRVIGELKIEDRSYRLEDFCGVYTRLMDDRFLPELKNEPENSPKRRHCRSLHDALSRWYEIAPTRVVNRTGPMGSNFSKPYQLQLIRNQGFLIPDTLITNDPALVLDYLRKHGRIIYKSISSVRSIVKTVENNDLERLNHIRWCPVQFQEFVEGTNVRVHTVNNEIFATAITTDTTDYRYASREGENADLEPIDLPEGLSERCILLSQSLGLPFAGIDLKIRPDNKVYCFEVNPSPAFSYYENNTGQKIANAVVRYLAGMG
jgi:hypothetical protein